MNTVKLSCGCIEPADGSPGSAARKSQKRRKCRKPRCRSGLPAKFSDRECAAYCWLYGRMTFVADLVDKTVRTEAGTRYTNLVECAQACGWEG